MDLYMHVLNYDFEKPTDPNQTLGELIKGRVSYTKFKEKCYELADTVTDYFLVRALLNHILSAFLMYGDKTDLGRAIAFNKSLIEQLKVYAEETPERLDTIHKCIESTERRIKELPTRVEEIYALYVSFCQDVVAALFLEELETPAALAAEIEKHTGRKLTRSKVRQSPRF
jgi:hypothetical protein